MAEPSSGNIGWDPLRVELLWGLKQRPSRGPKPTLTVEKIARTGIEIADEEGLTALSMQRIADRLGVGTMSLYTYVPDKASLLEVMLDMAFEGTTPPDRGKDWRHFLEAGAMAILAAYGRHAWAIEVFMGGPPLGPSQLRFLEAGLQALDGTGLSDEEKVDVVLSISSYARGAAHLVIGITQNLEKTGMTEEELQTAYVEAYARVLDPDHFPAASAIFATPPGGDVDAETDFGFGFGLQRLLDGIGALIESRSSQPA